MGQTFAEKILSKYSGRTVVPGEIVDIKPDIAMSHDNTAAISGIFEQLGVDTLDDPDRHVVVLDHCTPPANEIFAMNHKITRAFVKKHGIKHFFDIEAGICHQVIIEGGLCLPGTIMVGADSHSTTYGAFGAFGTGIGRSETAVIMATGKIWFRVPETIKIIIEGEFPEGTGSKDLILKIAGEIKADGALYKAVEFAGPTIENMSVSSRIVLPNMAVELGAKIGYMIPNEATLDYLEGRAQKEFEVVESDADATFDKIVEFDISELEPQIACPHTVDNVNPITEVVGTKIDEVFFGSCTNARLEDFEIVAEVLDGKKVHRDVRMLVFPASRDIFLEAMRLGYVQTIAEAGAIIMNSGCGPCMGNHEGVPASGEVVLATNNRNFRGRLGNRESEVYLSSPLVAAYSALNGVISDPRNN
ncbi:MAG: 3-isopropylmalate dehydratase large subunit [Candidatus Marinimicrobia bacterium]|nr:3-isopropylmalate dehydratase large subunit [Candidatus Neomarinimicrobiota bacterium]